MPFTKKSYQLFLSSSIPQEWLCMEYVYICFYSMCISLSHPHSGFLWDRVYHYTQSSLTRSERLASQLQWSPLSICPALGSEACATALGLCVGTGGIRTQIFMLAWQAICQRSTWPAHSSDWLCCSLHTEIQFSLSTKSRSVFPGSLKFLQSKPHGCA